MKKIKRFSKIQVLRGPEKGMIEIDVNGNFEEEKEKLVVYLHGRNSLDAHGTFDEFYDAREGIGPRIQINLLDGDEGYSYNNVRVIGGNIVGNIYVIFSK